ncbi:MAG: hypothetical protein PHE67_12195 [Campylobacterales bacterium]|nr:hypothetical protein [Campylobacterales bacterium]
MTIQNELKQKGYSVINYASSRGLDHDIFRQVIIGALVGRRKGKARDCIQALYKDGLLPLTHPMYETLVELNKEPA